MRVTLVRPPYYSLFGITQPTYPIGLGYLASYIREKGGHDPILVDGETGKFGLYKGLWETGMISNIRMFLSHTKFFQKNLDKMINIMEDHEHYVWKYISKQIINSNPDVVGISCYTTNVEAARNISMILKKEIPNIPIVVGGPHASALPCGILEHIDSADYAVFGEGEETFVELLEYLEKGSAELNSISGVVHRKNGNIVINSPRPFRHSLDDAPFPDRTLGDRGDYKFDDYFSTSRGCPFECTFCTVQGTWSRKVRYRSTEKIIEELKILKDDFGTQRVTFIDDTFTLKKARVMELCQAMIDNNLNKIPYSATSRADTLDEEVLIMMKNAGIKSIRFGIESGSPRIQNVIKKKIKVEKAVYALDLCNKHGVDSFVNFMVNHPTETLEDIKMSMDLFKRLSPTRGFVCMTMPFPKTSIHDYALSIGKTISFKDHYKFSINGGLVVNLSEIPDEVLKKKQWEFHSLIQRICMPKKIFLMIRTAINPRRLIKFLFRNYGVNAGKLASKNPV